MVEFVGLLVWSYVKIRCCVGQLQCGWEGIREKQMKERESSMEDMV